MFYFIAPCCIVYFTVQCVFITVLYVTSRNQFSKRYSHNNARFTIYCTYVQTSAEFEPTGSRDKKFTRKITFYPTSFALQSLLLLTCILIWFHLSWVELIWFDLMRFDVNWFDVIWFDVIWFDVIWFHPISGLLYSTRFYTILFDSILFK